jgi:hypothetical protein
MSDKYAYSLNGDQYRGAFSSRAEATQEAIAAARRAEDTPQSVFVGRVVPASAKADGHARAVISHMAARAREEFGDAASQYLANLSKAQIEELDGALELVVLGWLQQHELIPNFFKVEAIGEISVPTVHSDERAEIEYREVQEIGSGEYET